MQDIWRHIHSLMPMSAAARAACLSHSFLNSWRFHPNLTLNFKTLCPRTSRGNFRCKIDSILRNHLGTAKILKLNVADEDSTYPYIDRWLEVAVTPGIEELTLTLHKKYIFACSLLSDGVRDSIRCLELNLCAFHPMAELGPLRSLTKLHLRCVRITGDELRVPSFQLPCFGAVETLRMQQDKFPEDTVCAAASQLPECYGMPQDASDCV